MDTLVEVVIPVEAEAALALRTPAQRETASRYLSEHLRKTDHARLAAAAFAALKAEAHASGLTDEIVDAELAAWRAERMS